MTRAEFLKRFGLGIGAAITGTVVIGSTGNSDYKEKWLDKAEWDNLNGNSNSLAKAIVDKGIVPYDQAEMDRKLEVLKQYPMTPIEAFPPDNSDMYEWKFDERFSVRNMYIDKHGNVIKKSNG